MFLRDGARRFVFEGRECGGHVGPRSSFVLWEQMCGVLLEHIGSSDRGEELQVVFAGGIHDALSGAMVAALAAPLAQRKVSLGVLLGTAYLFTEEALACGAVVPRFQAEALRCQETVLLETGPGHAIRCIPTPYCETFEAERRRLVQEGRSHDEIVRAGMDESGPLAGGLQRPGARADDNGARPLTEVPEDDQYARGMYMIGQAAVLRDRVTTIAQMHAEICRGSTAHLQALTGADTLPAPPAPRPCDVAIIGLSCFYPGAARPANTGRISCRRWTRSPRFRPRTGTGGSTTTPIRKRRTASSRSGAASSATCPSTRCSTGLRRGAWRPSSPCNCCSWRPCGTPWPMPATPRRPFPRDRTAAVLGTGGGGSPLAVAYGLRACLRMLDSVADLPVRSADILPSITPYLPEWTEDSFPGILANVAVGRVANRFDLGGPNVAVDAACASSLAALAASVRELQAGTSDLALAMGADTVQTPYAYTAFSKTYALSPRGRCAPVRRGRRRHRTQRGRGRRGAQTPGRRRARRRPHLRRDPRRGASSDGKDKGLTAPNVAGQLRALRRAYDEAGISPAHLGLIEAHGTGTVVGDFTEAQALQQLLNDAEAPQRSCALGSVKSMIGHSKCRRRHGGPHQDRPGAARQGAAAHAGQGSQSQAAV